MCYLIAKKFGDLGCVALQTEHGPHLVDFEKRLIESVGYDTIQLVVISRPSAYRRFTTRERTDATPLACSFALEGLRYRPMAALSTSTSRVPWW